MKTVFYTLLTVIGFFFAACDSSEITIVPSSALQSIEVTPANAAMAKGTSARYTAMGTNVDGSKVDMTGRVAWSSSDLSIAAIDSNGTANAVSAGMTTIRAALGTLSGTAELNVTDAFLVSIAVTPTDPGIALGLDQQFTATGTFSDTSTQDITADVNWTSTDTGVAVIGNAGGSEGLAVSVSVGSAGITAVFDGVTSPVSTLSVTDAVLVAIAVTPADPGIALGENQQFTATGTYSDDSNADITTDVAWDSSAPDVAIISNAGGYEGLAASVSVGMTTISASLDTVSAETTLTVE